MRCHSGITGENGRQVTDICQKNPKKTHLNETLAHCQTYCMSCGNICRNLCITAPLKALVVKLKSCI